MRRDQLVVPEPGIPAFVETVSFWGAIVLPFVYLPMLLVGLETLERQLLFLGLLSLNVMMVVLGNQHRRR